MPSPHCLIIGTGPAGLLAADLLSAQGVRVTLVDRRAAPGWKLLVAGASGLNVTYGGEDLASHYPARQKEIAACLEAFSREDWLAHLAGLGEEVFLGTSRRYFVRNHTASSLLSSWRARLEARGVSLLLEEELAGFRALPEGGAEVDFVSGRREQAHTVLLALGGPSWEKEPPRWPSIFLEQGFAFTPFTPANAGYHLHLPPEFFAAAEGKPIKGLTLRTALGEKTGECMITRYGLEGTPVYSVGCPGPATMDLKPDITLERLESRMQAAGSSAKALAAAKLSPGAQLLFEALSPDSAWEDGASLAAALKRLPIELGAPRDLGECISARGGLSWDELSSELELKRAPSVFCAGEMVDWDAPTGGFLIQASVSMAAVAARGILRKFEKNLR